MLRTLKPSSLLWLVKRRLMDSSGAVEQTSNANQVDMYLQVWWSNMKYAEFFGDSFLVLKKEEKFISIYIFIYLIAIFFGSSMRR